MPSATQPGPGVERLVLALDRERDPRMEWHDGPDYGPVDRAVGGLADAEWSAAAELVRTRLEQGYDIHLGRAAVLLGGRETERGRMLSALEAGLRREKRTALVFRIAGNILALGPSAEAQGAFRRIVAGGSTWSVKVDALCTLKALLQERPADRPLAELLPPETARALLAAVTDGDYLVRYHAADALRRAAGIDRELAQDRELFGLICGKNAQANAEPDPEDRQGFERAKELLSQPST